MKIRYTTDNNVLGEVKHTDFYEVLVPFYNANKADTFVFRNFSNDSHKSWKVDGVKFLDQIVEVSLSKAQQSISVGVIARQGNSSVNRLLAKFNIVEVDFGHKVSSFNTNGSVNDNLNCSSTHLPGELYKRRPSIVLSVDGNRVQVLPLTTSTGSIDPESFELSPDSFRRLHAKYTVLPSRTLPRMLQTVSSCRVFPPMLSSGSFPATCFSYKLCHQDKLALKEKLASHFGSELVIEHQLLKNEVGKLKKEKKAIVSSNAGLNANLSFCEDKVSQLFDLIKKVGDEYGAEGEPEEILQALL